MARIIGIVLLAALALLSAGAPAAAAQARTRCFPETGSCVSGPILDYWERNGGLAVFGFPIAPLNPNEIVEWRWVGPVQWFERDRLEDHGAEGVMAGRLGARALELRGIDWWDLPQVNAPPAGCAYFPETRHSLCEPFLGYWRRNGGLERFGYPISEPMQESVEQWAGTVQYFERRRMEHHTELAGTPFEVLLGRLGAEVRAAARPDTCDRLAAAPLRAAVEQVPFRQWLGCPSEEYNDVPAAVQHTTGGVFIWVDLGGGGRDIFVAYRSSVRPGNLTVQQRFSDTWQEGVDPIDYFAAGGGVYPPRRGFGKVYFQHFRRGPESPGFGVEPERAERATVQRYTSGATVLLLHGEGAVYAFGADPLEYARVPKP